MPTKMEETNDILAEFIARFQALKLQRDTSESLIEHLLSYCEKSGEGLRQDNISLRRLLKEIKLELDDAHTSCRDLQQRLQEAEAQVQSAKDDVESVKNRNLYVLVLIDGDGLIFQEQYIKQGIEGGKKATYALRQTIVALCGKQVDEIEIVAKVCANLTGLARAMCRDGCIDSEFELRDFAIGFTQAKAHFDFIDVGFGKERADSKIKELTRWHLRNYNCKHLFLGVSHDSGYAPFLDEILQDHDTRSRVTVIEGVPTVRELRSTNVNILSFEDLFRAEKLINNRSLDTSYAASFPFNLGQANANLASATSATSGSSDSSGSSGSSGTSGSPILSNNTTATTSASAPATWAKVMRCASPPPQITLPLKPRVTKPRVGQAKPAVWNPGARGLDATINVDQTVLENIRKRKDADKLCNNHYLRGPCNKGSDCCFEHRYKPTAEEVKAIAVMSRLSPCSQGQDCDLDSCIYGHHCPSVTKGMCHHPHCRFSVADHPPGTKFKNPRIEDN
ncbi:hypothetical protein ACHAQA_003440 [Verticillium albo-atrum]